MKKIECDCCKKQEPEEGLIRWWALAKLESVSTSYFGESNRGKHFCSLKCVSLWAAEQE